MKRYEKVVLELMPRLLSCLDRDPDSSTYGSFDRNYWMYRTVDFPSGILQQNCYTLALVYANDFENNIYFKNPLIKKWALAAVQYWHKIQHKDGSFDEYWKYESGLPPTVFSTVAISETLRILEVKPKKILRSLTNACGYMARNPERLAVNQEVAAVCAIYSVYLHTKNPKLLNLFEKKLRSLKKFQSPEGFFYEQKGADAGYLTVSIHYLALLFVLSNRLDVKEMCDNAINFLSYMVHPDGTLGGIYGSRNTEYFMPAGLVIMANSNNLAHAILEKTNNFRFKNITHLPVDERYLLHYVASSYALALVHNIKSKKNNKTITSTQGNKRMQKEKIMNKRSENLRLLPYTHIFTKKFPDAGLLVISEPKMYCIINIKKGGVFKLYSGEKLLANDLGYRIKEKGTIYYSEYGNENPSFSINVSNVSKPRLTIKKFFSPKKPINITPLKKFILTTCSYIFGTRFRTLVKTAALIKSEKSNFWLHRTITFQNESILIEDKIGPRELITKKKQMQKIVRVSSQSVKLIPSSKFFNITELTNKIERKVINYNGGSINTLIDLKHDVVNVTY